MEKMSIRKLVQVGLLIALEIVLSRFLSISTPIVKIGFAFLPLVVTAMLFGPVYAGVAGGVSDFIGALLFPIGPYFPGFTLTNMLTGVVFGLLLYKKEKTWLRIGIAVAVTTVVLSLCLNTLWISVMYGKGFIGLLPTRILQNAIMLPIEIVCIRLVWMRVCNTKWMTRMAVQ